MLKKNIQSSIIALKVMHNKIIEMGDEEVYMDWIALGVPDEPTESDYEFIAESIDDFIEVVKLFVRLTT